MLIKSEILSLLNKALNQTAKLRKGGTEATYYCKCGHYKRKLEVNLDTFQWHCWVCNSRGSYLGGLLKLFNSHQTYRNKLRDLIGDIRLAKRQDIAYESSVLSLPEEFKPLSIYKNNPEYKNALVYLIRRGILPEDIIRYNIGYCDEGEYEHHVIIPSYDAQGALNFFIGRRYYDVEGCIPHKKPDCSMNLVGFESFINYDEPLILVESAFNSITIRRNAIPLFGKFPSKKLCEAMIVNSVKKVYVCLDNDARKDAINLGSRLLRMNITPYFVNIVGGKDPNEIGFEKSWECINNAVEMDFSFMLKEKLNNI